MKEQSKIATKKLSRTAISGMAATKLGAKHLGYLGKRALTKKENRSQLREEHNRELGQLMFATLSQLRGTALKASQILSTEASFLPENIRAELARACYQVPPLNRALIRKVFIKQLQSPPENLFAKFDSNAFAAASIGQVHSAQTKDGDLVAVKIQYPGIAASIDSDLAMLQGVLQTLGRGLSAIPNKSVISHTMAEIKERLSEEVDYQREAEYTKWFRQKLDPSQYCVAKVYHQYSNQRILTTEKIPGLHIDQWLAKNPNQTQRNHFGQLLFNYFLQSNFELKTINPDFHPGNFLFLDDGRLGILDFGCVKSLGEDYPKAVSKLFSTFRLCQNNHNSQELMAAFRDIGLIDKNLDQATFEKDVCPSVRLVNAWFIEPFLAETFNFKHKTPYPGEVHKTGRSAIKHLSKLKEEQMSFDRGYLGLMNLLTKLEAEVKTTNPWL